MKVSLSRRTMGVIAVAAALFIVTLVGAFSYLGGPSGATVSTTCPTEQCTTFTGQTTTSTAPTTATTASSPTTATSTSTVATTTTTSTTSQSVSLSTSTTWTQSTTCCNASRHSLGFWVQESDIMEQYNATSFFDAMFLTPPYPSSLEVMIFAVLQNQINKEGCSATSGYVGASADYWGQVAQLADSYPNIRLIYEIAFNASQGYLGTYGLTCFDTLVQSFAPYPSVYGIGVEGEYTGPAVNLTSGEMQVAMADVTAAGKLFVSYYVPAAIIPQGGYDIAHTNFPAQGDQLSSLQKADNYTIGLSSGYYDGFAFPSTFTCPIGPNDVANGDLTNEPQGYDQCVVTTELSTALTLPGYERQFLELVPGFSSSGEFVGSSGMVTNQLWDNPVLRSWVWTDPGYAGNFTLSL